MRTSIPDVPTVKIGGLWVPAKEEKRFSEYPKHAGMPNLDITKIYDAVPSCKQLRLAVDIGAHIGATSIAMAQHFERVESFEVMPETFSILAKNAVDHGNITIHNIAVSEKPGKLRFEYVPKHTQLTRTLYDGEDPLIGTASRIVGPFEGSKARQVLVADESQLQEVLSQP